MEAAPKKKKPVVSELREWGVMNRLLKTCDLKEAERLLELEKNGRKRASFLKRLQGRVSRLKRQRDVKALGLKK